MRNSIFTTAKTIACALLLGALLALPSMTLRAQAVEDLQNERAATGGGLLDVLDQIKQKQAQQYEGSWAITVTPVVPPGVPPPPPIRTYVSVARGGAAIGSDRSRPFGSPIHGTWVHLGATNSRRPRCKMISTRSAFSSAR